MSRRRAIRRALISGAVGALQVTQQHFATKAREEAEAIREARLQEIRQRERAEDRQFQRETIEASVAQRAAERAEEREFRQADRAEDRAWRKEDFAMQEKARLEAEARSLAAQKALIVEQARHRDPSTGGFVEYIDAEGRPGSMTALEFSRLAPEQRQGWRFRGDPYGAGADALPSTTAAAPAAAGWPQPRPKVPPPNGLSMPTIIPPSTQVRQQTASGLLIDRDT